MAARNGRDRTTSGGETLLAHFVASGYKRAEPPILQPAAVFLDQVGEDIRGRLYLTTDAAGAELCLRPEFTLPVSLAYLASSAAGNAANFSYFGKVFRFRPDGLNERGLSVLQIGAGTTTVISPAPHSFSGAPS